MAGSAAGVAACSPNASNAPSRRRARRNRETEPAVDPDVLLAATVLSDEQRVLDLVEATIARFPRLEDALSPARDAHAAHIALLEEAVPDEPLPTAGPSATATESPDGSWDVPSDRRRAVKRLARREYDLALIDKRSAFAAESGAFARVLASMAASAAQHAAALDRLAEGSA
jgi:hypothetical protein